MATARRRPEVCVVTNDGKLCAGAQPNVMLLIAKAVPAAGIAVNVAS